MNLLWYHQALLVTKMVCLVIKKNNNNTIKYWKYNVNRWQNYCWKIDLNNDKSDVLLYAFAFSRFESITIPSSVVNFGIRWRFELLNLKNISIIPYKEKNICYYDDTFILGKSYLKSDVYYILLFVKPDIIYVFIPSLI